MASIFTKILSREIPGHFVWEDDLCFSIMTIQPIREGHLMVIPKLEVNHWDDVPPETAAHLMLVAQKIAKAIKGIIPCKRIGVSVVGLEVPHTHIHLIPIDNMGDLDFSRAQKIASKKLATIAKKIKKSLQARGYSEADV
jgi:diadenosine tetraphosphate (Ap4A) HIT family hydrolase